MSERTKGNGFKVKGSEFSFRNGRNHRKVEIVHCEGNEALERLPREAVAVPTMELLKVRLDGALNTLT